MATKITITKKLLSRLACPMGPLVAFMMPYSSPVKSFSRDNMSFSSKAIEVVNITNGSDVVVKVSYNLILEGTPKPQARPRLGRNGFFLHTREEGHGCPQG